MVKPESDQVGKDTNDEQNRVFSGVEFVLADRPPGMSSANPKLAQSKG